MIGALALLYCESELVRRFINVLLIQVRTSAAINNPVYLTYIFLETRKKWLNSSPKESLRLLLDTTSRFTYAEAFKAYAYNPNRMQDVLDKEDIISHQSLALDLLNSGDLSI